MKAKWGWIWVLSTAVVGMGCGQQQGEETAQVQAEGDNASETEASKEGEVKADEKAEANKSPVVIYAGRGEVLVGPLLDMFTKKTGIEVEVRYEKSSEGLANRIATEGKETPVDVFFAQDSGYLGALGEKGFLKKLPETLTSQVEEAYRDKGATWIPTSGRARVLVYSPERVKAEELPKTLMELTDKRFAKRLGWAPGNGSFQAHVSALRSIWGDEKTKTWLAGIKALEPTVYPKNGVQVRGVSNGEIDLGWVNHYYLHKIRSNNPDLKAANHSFPTAGDAGNVMMLSGAGVSSHSDNVENAEALLTFLVSEEAQNYFAQKLYEYPTRPGIKTHDEVPALTESVVRVDQAALTDVAPTLQILRELGLQ